MAGSIAQGYMQSPGSAGNVLLVKPAYKPP
jgi:hypothetical protein